jgi:nicotinamide mononucleotide (NMN) deamidase PncC
MDCNRMLLFPEQLVQDIHDSPMRVVLAATGGGSRAIADLLEVPGGSRTLLEAIVPYSAPAMVAFLGCRPDEFCSADTARAMALMAFQRARQYQEPAITAGTVAGVACTASLATDRPKRGSHRIHLALQTVGLTAAWRLQLDKGRRSRAEEERLTGRFLLNVVAEACGVAARLKLDLLEGEAVEASRTEAPPAWQDLLLGNVENVCLHPTGRPPKLILSGAFNPLHDGHRGMGSIAEKRFHEPIAYELSVINVDKPPLDYAEIEGRLGQFSAEQTIYLTRAATFEEKSRIFHGATFVVGADTIRRIGDPAYYGGDPAACQAAIERIARRNCRFLVFGRDMGKGFVRLGDLNLPEGLEALCREVPPEVFRADVSSTALRRKDA